MSSQNVSFKDASSFFQEQETGNANESLQTHFDSSSTLWQALKRRKRDAETALVPSQSEKKSENNVVYFSPWQEPKFQASLKEEMSSLENAGFGSTSKKDCSKNASASAESSKDA